MISIEVTDQQDALRFDERRLRQGAEAVLREGGFAAGSLSIAVVDDPAIHAVNKQFLNHDYPTDVLSFTLAQDGDHLEGEVIVSAQTAVRVAEQFGWSAEDELLLYVLHGTLHLIGYDDTTDPQRSRMRAAERKHLAAFGLEMHEESRGDDGGATQD